MDTYLTAEILKSLVEGDLKRSVAYAAIFFVIWLEVRGMKNQLKLLNKNIADRFSEGELRFEKLEERMTALEIQRGI